jgi:sulfur relay (sulfurtransferase) DsrC/TusE family protein
MRHIKQNNNLDELSINKIYFSQDVIEIIQYTQDYARKYNIRPNIIGIIT